jgi:hypothetical protein
MYTHLPPSPSFISFIIYKFYEKNYINNNYFKYL